jgi:6-pyruvoyltetrahydropterin/6-carboxytetrahydropterin synthase
MLGPISTTVGDSDSGMVMDFSDLKDIMNEWIHDELDHGFMVYEGDEEMRKALGFHDWKVIEFPYVPTAENIARWCYDQLQAAGLTQVYKVRVSETPNCWAIYKGEDA